MEIGNRASEFSMIHQAPFILIPCSTSLFVYIRKDDIRENNDHLASHEGPGGSTSLGNLKWSTRSPMLLFGRTDIYTKNEINDCLFGQETWWVKESQNQERTKKGNTKILPLSFDPLGWPTIPAGSDNYFCTCCPSVRPFVRTSVPTFQI